MLVCTPATGRITPETGGRIMVRGDRRIGVGRAESCAAARQRRAPVLTPAQRKLNMSCVRGRDTKPEMVIRQGLHARGLRYRLHDKTLPGRPDLVFAKYRTVVFVHGCFWHANGCSRSKLPATRQKFWKQKLDANAARDQDAIAALQDEGWRVLVISECALRGPEREEVQALLDRAAVFIRTRGQASLEMTAVGIEARQRDRLIWKPESTFVRFLLKRSGARDVEELKGALITRDLNARSERDVRGRVLGDSADDWEGKT